MIKVYYSKVSPFLEEDTFFSQLAKIPADRKEKILRMKNKEARMRSLTAGMLLQYQGKWFAGKQEEYSFDDF